MSNNLCIIKYNVHDRLIVSNNNIHQHHVKISAHHLAIEIFGVGAKGKYNRKFNLGDTAEYARDDKFSYYGKIKEIGDNQVIIQGVHSDVALSLGEFCSHNYNFNEDEAYNKNLSNSEF